MSNVRRFKVCLKCIACIPIIPESNFYELEKSFDNMHKNHLTVIMTTKEMFIYAEKQYIMKKIRKIDITLKNLKFYIDIPKKAEKTYLNELKNESKQLKQRLKQLKNEKTLFNNILNAQFKVS